MTKRIAALSCCLSLGQGSVVAGEDFMTKHPAPGSAAVVSAAPEARPLGRASLREYTETMPRAETRRSVRPIQDATRDQGSWMERHPVWSGTMVGFGAGFLVTYATTHDNGQNEFITIMSPAAGALIWGSVSAGVGALIGWGIGRNRDESP
jgi:hypothetical protein